MLSLMSPAGRQLSRVALATVLCVPAAALAVLGQAFSTPEASVVQTVGVPGAKLQSIKQIPASTLYRIQETQLEPGVNVREFATPQGQVFAVVWEGFVLPDLDALLGIHFAEFRRMADTARGKGVRGSVVSVNQAGLVVHSGGRARAFSGYAYLPALIPTGVAIDELLP